MRSLISPAPVWTGYAGTWVSGSWSGSGVDSAAAAGVYWISGIGEVGQ
ncbi:hypothetical protein [Mycolicibacterium aubagnense]|nr:hypothetical protein [Mycolicibacterium aubagnense]